MTDVLLKPTPHDEAAEFIRNKPVVSREAFDELLPDLRARAFVITGVEDANLVQAIRDRIAEVPQGADWHQVKREIIAQISPWLDQSTSEDGGAVRSERRAELLLRTHGFQAYAAAQYETMQRQAAAFPYWQYQTAGDERVRDTHAALDGLVLPADSPFWDTHFPPWDFGCRCQVVPLAADDVDAIVQQDRDKPLEARRLLDEARRRELELTGELTRAIRSNDVPQRYDMRAPEQRGGAYRFQPGTLRMSAEQLRPRYDAATWSTFEAWARATKLPQDERTVWQWLEQRPERPRRSRAPRAERVSTPTRILTTPPSRTTRPVSAAIEIRTEARHKTQITHAVEMIDQVHRDGDLTAIPIYGSLPRRSTALGMYQWRDGKPVQIMIRNTSRGWPSMTTAHEIGHLLDHQVLGEAGKFASVAHPALERFRDAVMKTDAVRSIQALDSWSQGQFLQPYELWARAYAQYIAIRSKSKSMLKQLDRIRSGPQSWRQWSDKDFEPVASAIDDLLRSKGWTHDQRQSDQPDPTGSR